MFKLTHNRLIEFYQDREDVIGFLKRFEKDVPIPKEGVYCDFCNVDDSKPYMEIGYFKVVQCKRCELIYVNPRFDDDQYKALYSEEYFLEGYDAEGNQHNYLEEKDLKQKDMVYEREAVEAFSGGKFLEIGSGFGFFLELLSDKWEKYGCEYSTFAVEHCRQNGLSSIFQGDLLDQKFDPNSFDCVTARYVVEHLKKPRIFFKELARIIKPSGHVVISCPNWGGITARLFGEFFRLNGPDEHIHWFTKDSLIRYLKEYGFKIEKVEYPYLRTSYFNLKELWNFFSRFIILNVVMPVMMFLGIKIRANIISPPFYGNIVMIVARKC